MKLLPWAGALALACLSSGLAAQVAQIGSPSTMTPTAGVTFNGSDGKAKVASPSNPLPVTTKSDDGADATLGSTADAPYSGTGAATIASALKGIYSQSLGPLPAGTATIGNVGGVQIPGTLAIGGGFRVGGLDSAGLFQDIKVDANGLMIQGLSAAGQDAKGFAVRIGGTDLNGKNQSIRTDTTGWLYSLPYALATLAPPTAATAGAKVPLWLGRYGQTIGGYSDGTADYYAAGTANGAFVQGPAPSGSPAKGNPTRGGITDADGNVQPWRGDSLGAGNVRETSRTAYFAETSTPLAAGATYMGSIHDAGGTIVGAPSPWGSFGCWARSDQSFTLTVRGSNDNSTFFTGDSIVVPANTSKYLSSALVAKYWKCDVTNGSTAQTYITVQSRFGL
ncbi:hypothetical protein KV697_10930 [Sphingomonas sanguinis]|uniref:hypothetical protein n=1 Tax=Sphingomonas sanguinis TaxID=33051 RepID=UPI001C59A8E7|nr:hypothetical protein [Sphingomonas sanguinis]QXT34348.1 hypothetical protein KV697_10930 [Sphingomonas sanguinis]